MVFHQWTQLKHELMIDCSKERCFVKHQLCSSRYRLPPVWLFFYVFIFLHWLGYDETESETRKFGLWGLPFAFAIFPKEAGSVAVAGFSP